MFRASLEPQPARCCCCTHPQSTAFGASSTITSASSSLTSAASAEVVAAVNEAFAFAQRSADAAAIARAIAQEVDPGDDPLVIPTMDYMSMANSNGINTSNTSIVQTQQQRQVTSSAQSSRTTVAQSHSAAYSEQQQQQQYHQQQQQQQLRHPQAWTTDASMDASTPALPSPPRPAPLSPKQLSASVHLRRGPSHSNASMDTETAEFVDTVAGIPGTGYPEIDEAIRSLKVRPVQRAANLPLWLTLSGPLAASYASSEASCKHHLCCGSLKSNGTR